MTLQATYSTTTPAFRLTTTPDSGVALPLTDPSALGNRPLAAFLQATTHDVRWTVDGTTPTSSHGMVLTAGAAPFLYAGDLSGLRFIQSASGSVLNVVYAGIADTVGPQGPPGIQGATGSQGAQGPAAITIAQLAALGVYPGGKPSVVIDFGAISVDSSGFDVIPSPGAGAYLIPDVHALIGVDNCSGVGFGWDAGELIFAFDGDTKMRFAGGRFTFMSKATEQEVTHTNPINAPWKVFLIGGYPADLSISAAGTGYAVGDTVKDPFDGTLHVTVDTVGGGGEVLTWTKTADSEEGDYAQGDSIAMVNVAPQSGAGSGFILQADSLRGGIGSTLKITYDVMKAP